MHTPARPTSPRRLTWLRRAAGPALAAALAVGAVCSPPRPPRRRRDAQDRRHRRPPRRRRDRAGPPRPGDAEEALRQPPGRARRQAAPAPGRQGGARQGGAGAARRPKEQLQKKYENLQRSRPPSSRASMVEYQREMQRKESEMTTPILQGVLEAVKRIAAQEGYEMVLEKSAVPYFRGDLELTDRAIQMYNSGQGAHPRAPPGKAPRRRPACRSPAPRPRPRSGHDRGERPGPPLEGARTIRRTVSQSCDIAVTPCGSRPELSCKEAVVPDSASRAAGSLLYASNLRRRPEPGVGPRSSSSASSSRSASSSSTASTTRPTRWRRSSTRTRSSRASAVVWSGICNFIGVFLGGTAVAFSIVNLLPVELLVSSGAGAGLAMVLALLLAAILWNLGHVVPRPARVELAHAHRRDPRRRPRQLGAPRARASATG